MGERLREARRARGLSQEDVAEHLGVSRPTLVNIEQGRRAPRPEEVVRLAQLYGRRVQELTRRSPPVVGVAAQFRAVDGAAGSGTTEAIDDLQRLADSVVTLEELAGSPTPRRYPAEYDVTGLPLDVAAEQVAEAERQRLGLGDGPVLHLRQVLEGEVGLRVFAVPLASKVAGLFSQAEPAGGCIAINAHHPHERQRWTLAHEYAHFLTARWTAEITTLASGRASSTERLAEAFAAHFLMPSVGVTRRFQAVRRSREGRFTPVDLLQLAAVYEVSAEAMAHRLEGLRLIKGGWWADLRSRGLRVDDARRDVGLPVPHRDEQLLPRRVQYLAVESFVAGDLSEGQLSAVLRLDRSAARALVKALNVSADVDGEGQLQDFTWDPADEDDAAVV